MLTNMKKFVSRTVSSITAMVMAFVITTAPAGSAGAEQITDTQLKDMALEIAYLVNEFRAEHDLPPVYVVPYLCDVAQIRSRECIFKFDHLRPDGTKFSSAVDANLIPYHLIFENIAAGYETPEETMQQWIDSPKHCETMLNPDITHMGVGVGYDPNSTYEYYWEQTFVVTDSHFREEYIPTKHYVVPQAEGDVTGDAVIDTFDYLALADFIYKSKQNVPVYLNPEQLETADCFRDGLITEADAQVLVSFILGKRSKIPVRPSDIL